MGARRCLTKDALPYSVVLELVPDVLVGHFMVEANLLGLYEVSKFSRAPMCRGELLLNELLFVFLPEKFTDEVARFEVTNCIVNVTW